VAGRLYATSTSSSTPPLPQSAHPVAAKDSASKDVSTAFNESIVECGSLEPLVAHTIVHIFEGISQEF
jgi:hypothetical protein